MSLASPLSLGGRVAGASSVQGPCREQRLCLVPAVPVGEAPAPFQAHAPRAGEK